jgi:hypothetical protein
MFRSISSVIAVIGISIWMSTNFPASALAADINLGFKARIADDVLNIQGSGVPRDGAKNAAEAARTAMVAAMVDALRNLGEAVRLEKELVKEAPKRWSPADKKEFARTAKLFSPLHRIIKTTCQTAAGVDGKSRFERCTFNYGPYSLQSSTDMQNNTITADVMTLRTLEHAVRIVDFALASSACSDLAEVLPDIIGKMGFHINSRQLPDGSAEVDLIYRKTLRNDNSGTP